MYVNEFFSLRDNTIEYLQTLKPEFGYNGFGELVFYRTYSRIKDNGKNETWFDVVVRCIEGTMSIRKDWYIKNRIAWNEKYWQDYAANMAVSMFKMHWMPPGRGLWAMGTTFIYENGSMALNNCGFTKIGGNDRIAEDFCWLMDSLMLGVGVGFEPLRDDLKVYKPKGEFIYDIPDSREGWVNSVRLKIDSRTIPNCKNPLYRFHLIRDRGLPIKGFGGLASGPDPLKILLEQIDQLFDLFEQKKISVLRLKTDIANLIGCCVVAGNVRRSAEIATGSIHDQEFLDLKNYEINPERANYGWMSNNSVKLEKTSDFELLGEVARRVVVRGEPGILNLKNFKHGRIGKFDNVPVDEGDGINPCAEMIQEDKETCNVIPTFPTKCKTKKEWHLACEYAAFYGATVSLLPTHQEATNRVIAKNRRSGVDFVDYTGWKHEIGLTQVVIALREGYKIVRDTNRFLARQAGVPESVRVTTVKPGGTVPKLVGKTPGIGHPTFKHTLRRVRIAIESPVVEILRTARVPNHPDQFDPKTMIFEFPILQGPSKPAEEVSLWEQAMNLVKVQEEWSDNAVSNTLYFKPKWSLFKSNTQGLNRHLFIEEYTTLNMEKVDIELNKFFENPSKTYQFEMGKWKIVCEPFETKIYEFNPNHEEDQIEFVLASIVSKIKSCSLLPHSTKGAYVDMPEEGITEEKYNELLSDMQPIDWSDLCGSTNEVQDKYCEGPSCELNLNH